MDYEWLWWILILIVRFVLGHGLYHGLCRDLHLDIIWSITIIYGLYMNFCIYMGIIEKIDIDIYTQWLWHLHFEVALTSRKKHANWMTLCWVSDVSGSILIIHWPDTRTVWDGWPWNASDSTAVTLGPLGREVEQPCRSVVFSSRAAHSGLLNWILKKYQPWQTSCGLLKDFFLKVIHVYIYIIIYI